MAVEETNERSGNAKCLEGEVGLTRFPELPRERLNSSRTQSCTPATSTSLMALSMLFRSSRAPEGSCDELCVPMEVRSKPYWCRGFPSTSALLCCFGLVLICSLLPVGEQAGVYVVTYGGNNISLGLSNSFSRSPLSAAWPAHQLFLTLWQNTLTDLGAAAVRPSSCYPPIFPPFVHVGSID